MAAYEDRFFELSIDMLFVGTFDGRCIRVNPACTEITGFTPDELIGEQWLDYVHADDLAASAAALAQVAAGKPLVNFENRCRVKDGSYKWYLWNAVPATEQGLVYAIARDITERKLAEAATASARDQAVQAERFKSDFVAALSHELRTPMNVVVGATQLLAGTELNDEQREYAQALLRASETLLGTLNQVLDVSKIEAGKVSLVHQDFSVAELVASVAALFDHQAAAKRLNFSTYVSPGLPVKVQGDPGRLRQILVNLVNNAIKYTDADGSVSLRAVVEYETIAAVNVRFSVSDTGVGFSEEEKRQIFEPFVRPGRGGIRNTGGSGLGLSISKALVELMGGTIEVESAKGKGSTFTFNAPLRQTRAISASVNPTGKIRFLDNGHRTPRILLVEDDMPTQKIVKRQLELLGADVETIESGREALAAMENRSYDLVFMDVRLPDLDGLGVTRRIRALSEKNGAHTPIVAMTAWVMEHDRETCISAGMNDYLSKPVTSDQLREVLSRWL